MVSVCLPSDALLQHLPSYLGFSYPGRRVSRHSCSIKAQPLLLTAALPDLQSAIALLGPPAPSQPSLLGLLLPAAAPGLGCRVAPQGHGPWLSDMGCLLPAATDLGRGVAPLSHPPWPRTQCSSSRPLPLTSDAVCLLLAAPDLGLG